MARVDGRKAPEGLWRLVSRQHGVVARAQLLMLGFSQDAIEHRLAVGRLIRVRRGVYAVGRPDLSKEGRWMAAVLACGAGAVLSHTSAGALWRISMVERGTHISLPSRNRARPAGLHVHRPASLPPEDIAECHHIPVTSPVRTLIDLATELDEYRLEAAINAADKHDRVDPVALRDAIAVRFGQRGVPALRRILERHTFVLTRSELERRFLRIARSTGLPPPETRVWLSGFEVDFYWRDLGLVVETDGQRYHRTAIQQTRDRRRDQAHAAAGLTQLRFSHYQVRYEPGTVAATLKAVARRCIETRAPAA